MSLRVAPVLHALAGRLAGRPPEEMRTAPMQWAYALRDAAGLAHPDVLVSHWDARLEADALASGLPADGDWVDRVMAAPALRATAPAREAVELVATLAGLFRSGPQIAATLTGPASTAAVLAPALLGSDPGEGDRVELADLCADALADLVGAYGEAGATMVVVVEHDAAFLSGEDASDVQSPLVRALAHHRLEGVAIAPDGLDLRPAGYAALAVRWEGAGTAPDVALLDPAVWDLAPDRFAERWPALHAEAATAGALLISDGPLPAAMPLENLQTARAAHA
jgi:hypothetical protein